MTGLPTTYSALVLTSTSPLAVETRPLPTAIPGNALVRILFSPVISSMGEVYSCKRSYLSPTSFVPGTNAIGSVAAVGPNATANAPRTGQAGVGGLFPTRSARMLMELSEGFDEGATRLMREGVERWDINRVCEGAVRELFRAGKAMWSRGVGDGGTGYELERLSHLSTLLVQYGRLRDVGLQAGETVIVTPATGAYEGVAVQVALVMDTGKMIAMGRNQKKPREIQGISERVAVVAIISDMEKEAEVPKQFGPVNSSSTFRHRRRSRRRMSMIVGSIHLGHQTDSSRLSLLNVMEDRGRHLRIGKP